MALISQNALEQVAQDIEPYVEDIIVAGGQLTREVITVLARKHGRHKISSERSCRIVGEYLCGD